MSNSGAKAAARASEQAARDAAKQARLQANEKARQSAAQASAAQQRERVSQEVAALDEQNKPLDVEVDLAPEARTTTTRKRQKFTSDQSGGAGASIRI